MRHYVLGLEDACVTSMEFDLDKQQVVHNVKFTGGCQNNLNVLVENMENEGLTVLSDVIKSVCCKDYTARQCAPKLKNSLILAINNFEKNL